MRLIAGEIPPRSQIYGSKQEGPGGLGWDWGLGLLLGWITQSGLGCPQRTVPSFPPSSSQNKVHAVQFVCFLKLNLGSWADAELGQPVTSARELAGLHALTPGALNPALLPRGQHCRSSSSSTRGSSARGVCRTLSG